MDRGAHGTGWTNRLRYRWNPVPWANPKGHLARSAAAGTARLRSADQLLATAAEVCAGGGGGCHPKAPGPRSLTPFITAGAAAEQAAFGRDDAAHLAAAVRHSPGLCGTRPRWPQRCRAAPRRSRRCTVSPDPASPVRSGSIATPAASTSRPWPPQPDSNSRHPRELTQARPGAQDQDPALETMSSASGPSKLAMSLIVLSGTSAALRAAMR
jgi:hypothetical protein